MNECPIETVYSEANIANHVIAIKYAHLGPADPREVNAQYWAEKQELWEVPEGKARSQLCMNCEYYNKSEEALRCISDGAQVKPSDIPVVPAWADIEGMPVGLCLRWNITCSGLRTCDTWEPMHDDEDEAADSYSSSLDYTTEKALETFKPTTGMASEARRALKWRQEGNRGGTQVGLVRANQLVKRQNLSRSTVLRMYSFFSRHEVDKNATGFSPGEAGYPSPGRVAWGLWGGDAGFAWSRAKRDQIMKQ